MFSPALGRAVRSTCAISSSSAVCTGSRPATITTLGAGQQTLSRRPHQRRLSSSKANSIPPDNSNGSSSAEAAPAASTARSPVKKLTGRAGKRRTATPPLNVPHVPPTDYLQKPEVKISSFFSLHRPISVTAAVPSVSTSASFEAIFHGPATNGRPKLVYDIHNLTGGIASPEAFMRGHEGKHAHGDVASDGMVRHLDGVPEVSVDQMLAHFLPFKAPPVPIAINQAAPTSETVAIDQDVPTAETVAINQAAPTSETAPIPQREAAITQPMAVAKKVWTSTVVVTESITAAGKRTYAVSKSPMVQIPPSDAAEYEENEENEIRQPFLGRMRQRDNEFSRILEERSNKKDSGMQLISVKRQRKLKMKKHKYKKLMKKTRLERRKLDRN